MWFKKTLNSFGVPIALLFGAQLASADTIRVPADQPTIQSAIDMAVSGDNVLVSAGVYFEQINFSGKDIIVESESGAAATTINGSATGTVVTIASAEPQSAILRGFTITNGLANSGAGIQVSSASPIIEDNIISGNVACEGAGINVTGSASSALIRRNTFTSNSKNSCGTGYGGGINVNLNANAEISNNTFTLNSNTYGAGIHLEGAGTVPITENEFFNNTAAAQGGAIATFNGADSLIQQNVMYGNAADEGGAIVFNVPPAGPAPAIVSNTIFNNSINNITFGSGILAHGFPPSVVVRNNIVIATPGQSAIDCLVTGGTAMDIPDFRSNLVYSDGNLDFFGDCDGQSGVNGNLTGPASFANGANGDFRLQQASSAIDSAEADASITLDFAGNTRTVDGNNDQVAELDMGAFEAQPPDADAGPNQSVNTDSGVSLDATGSGDADGTIATYTWLQTTGVTVTLSDSQAAEPTFAAPSSADTLTFALTVADDLGFSDSDTVVVTVTGGPPPQPPVADAGPDQTVDANDIVTLVGTGSSDPDGTITGYSWSQTGGTSVSLSDNQSATPSFTAPSIGDTLSFELTVTDSQGLTDSDAVSITVTPVPVPPTADAGADQSVDADDAVSLDGSASFDPDGSIVGYAWTQTGGTTVTLSDPQSATPSFTAPSGGDTLTFDLTVTDNQGLDDSDVVVITVAPPPISPIADAGPDQTVDADSAVTLDGTGSSDPDGSIGSYTWNQISGTTVTLTNADSSSPSFTAPSISDSLTFVLTVTDNQGLTDSDEVNVTVTAPLPPVADAGLDQAVETNSAVTMNGGNSSDPDGNIVSYAWSQSAGTTVSLSGAQTVSPSFTAPGTADSLTFILTVTDDSGLTDTDSISITVTSAPPPPQSPVADAGPDQSVGDGASVTLDGSSSMDPDGSIVGYTWTQISGTAVTLNNAQTAAPSFTAPSVNDSLTFVLTVTDNDGLTNSDEVIIDVTIAPPPAAPVADAGPDQSVGTGVTVALNGNGSSDPDGTISSFSWTQSSGATVTLSDVQSATPGFTAPAAASTLRFTLTVTDDQGFMDSDEVVVSVTAPPPPAPTPTPSSGGGGSIGLLGLLTLLMASMNLFGKTSRKLRLSKTAA